MPKSAQIILKPGRDKSVHHRHPWLFSGAIGRVEGAPTPGDIVRIASSKGEFLAWGYFNAQSQIAVRLLSWEEGDRIDAHWWTGKITTAIKRREKLADDPQTNTYRVIYSEADGLPGLIVDRYADCLACQFLTAGIDHVREVVVETLWEQLRPTAIIDLSDNDMRKVEGVSPAHGLLRGALSEKRLVVCENGFRYTVDLSSGQKTGFYLDQRVNRLRIMPYAVSRRVLDCFCYTGGFAIPVLASSPQSLTCIDSSATSLELLRANVRMLAEDGPRSAEPELEILNANVFEELRKFRDQGRAFDMIILDPPKLAASQSQVRRAMRAYKDLNLIAMKLLTPGGVLATFSCSGAVSRADLQNAVAWAATDAGRRVQIIEQMSQSEDHPVIVSFPESEYLKGLLCIVD